MALIDNVYLSVVLVLLALDYHPNHSPMALVRANNAVQRVDLPQGCRMHPDFRDGDLLITCPNPRGKNRTGFRVNSNILILSRFVNPQDVSSAPH